MCGILGVVGDKPDENLFKTALSRLEHRGPDGFGIWRDAENRIIIGHRRLSIIDLSEGGKQPIEIGNYVLTFNGEIYNYIELRKILQAKGHRFTTESDAEVLLKSFIEWKEKCLGRFNGMWSFVIYNKSTGEVFLSRDRFGKKPLFYFQNKDLFVFASEMKAITPFMDRVEASPDFQWMIKNYSLYEATDKCLINGIKRFPAGHYGIYNSQKHKITFHKYWDTLENLVSVPKRYEDQVEQYRDLFIDACKIRMRSDVSIGTALSGGLDSSGVICTMAHIGKNVIDEKATQDWQHAYVACFPGSFLDERMYAEKVVSHLGINATYLSINPEAGIERLNDYFYYFEEIYDTSPIPMSNVYQAMAHNGIKVSIDGHGVDESFSGYGKSLFEAFLDTCRPKEIKEIINTYRELHPVELTTSDSSSDLIMYLEYMFKRRKTVLRNLIKKIPVLTSLIQNGPIEKLGNFNYNLFLLFHQSVLPTLLRNYDRYSMMHGVEIRMPFMDHRLISMAFSLPWQSKIRNGYTKSIIRDALKDFMPAEIAWRKQKIGFQTPVLEYIRGPWKNFFSDTIHSDGFRNSSFSDPAASSILFKKITQTDKANYFDGRKFWMEVVPYLWEQAFLKKI